MLLQIVLFVLGLGVLYVGADWLIKGASSVALHFGLRPMTVGLTVVALGTSMPEFILNLFAVEVQADGLAIGNIIGSNIANIAFILGISAVLLPMSVERKALKREYPIVLGVSLLFWLLALDGSIGRGDGFLLLSGLVAFLVYLLVDARNHRLQSRDERALLPVDTEGLVAVSRLQPWRRAGLVIAGIVLLAIGARLMVHSAVIMAETLQVSQVVIGLTIVAIGTSLPELAASLICILRNESDMSIGNILGSNLFNILFVVGLVAVIRPMTVEPVAFSVHFPVMIGFTLLLFPFAWTRQQISRTEGGVLLAGFTGYLAYLIVPYLI